MLDVLITMALIVLLVLNGIWIVVWGHAIVAKFIRDMRDEIE